MGPHALRRGIAPLVIATLVAATGCGNSQQPATDAPPSETASEAPAAAPSDPCKILTMEEIQRAFPEINQVLAAENRQCLYDSLRVDLKPLTRAAIEAEAEPTGWRPRSIDVPGAEWAVVRIDSNVTEYAKVLDVLAGGPKGTVHLIPWGKRRDIRDGSAEYEALVELLRTAYRRL